MGWSILFFEWEWNIIHEFLFEPFHNSFETKRTPHLLQVVADTQTDQLLHTDALWYAMTINKMAGFVGSAKSAVDQYKSS